MNSISRLHKNSQLINKAMLFKLGPLGRFKLTRDIPRSARSQPTTADASCQTNKVTRDEVSDPAPYPICDDPPPSYSTPSLVDTEPPSESESESESQSTGEDERGVEVEGGVEVEVAIDPPKAACVPTKRIDYVVPPGVRKLTDRENQLHHYLMEIIAFALDVNFDELNSALYKQPIESNTNTILTDEEREELLHLSRFVQKLSEKMRRNQINTAVRAEVKEANAVISNPATTIGLRCYAVDLVASYAEYAEDADIETARRTKTLLAHWTCNPKDWATDTDRDLKGSLNSCARAIEVVAYPKEEAQHVLGRALERYQQECGVEAVKYKSWCHPTRDGIYELWGYMVHEVWKYDDVYTRLY
jgi:hypothetical protein